ncbi:MAG TPA: ACP phosphodiesterase [Chitinophagaceae bacterium]|nr:ACP phosphodiesterase [Chitinophagaceae bacterium]
MNYLAHAYLSFGHPGVLTGNMISDFVKGKKKFDYPSEVQQGIELHRAIDQFTDTHIATREAKQVFRAHYRLYSGAFTDVVYDHFLANDESEFTEESLFAFSRDTYAALDRQEAWMPDRFAHMYPFMKQQNWLFNYRTRWGIKKSMGGLVKRAAYLEDYHTAFVLFEEHYQLLEDCYRHFWAELKPWAKSAYDQLSL